MCNNANVVACYTYDPYGRRTRVSGSEDADFGFTGHFYHEPSGLHLTLFRAYDANIGRWLSRDPIGEAGGMNLYGYVRNNPISRVDPLGLAWYDGIAAMTGFGSPGSFSGSWSGFSSSWSDSANSIGQALGGALAGNWDQVADAYDSGVFGQTQDADPVTYYGTRGAVGTASAATAAVVALKAAPVAVIACKKLKDNLHFDGPKWNNKDPQTGRIGQLRWGNMPLIRLDYHAMKNRPIPVLHLNIGPGNENLHIPIGGDQGPSMWQ